MIHSQHVTAHGTESRAEGPTIGPIKFLGGLDLACGLYFAHLGPNLSSTLHMEDSLTAYGAPFCPSPDGCS